MVSILQRGLFWRVYLTLFGSLILVAVVGAMLWHRLAEQPMPMNVGTPGAALGALLPDKDAPRAQVEAVLQRLSTATGARVALIDANGQPIDAAQWGRTVAAPDLIMGGPLDPRAHEAMMRIWRARLPDGRSLWIESPERFRPAGPHMLGMLMAVAAAIGLAAYPIVARLTRRLETLRSSLDAWGSGKLDSRARIEGKDEIAAVAASFNTAADRVESLLAAHKALLAHASHELRSPLTRLRLAVEMFAAHPDPALRPAIVQDIAELDGLVEEILLASRLDQAPISPERQRVDVLGLAAEEAARAGAAVSHAGPSDAAFEVEGSARLLRRLIRNLVENAGKHGQPPVEVTLAHDQRPSGAWITISVHDHGPGIPEAERERVFEPFYRPSGRAEAAGSWGLGLSIVRQIAERHGGTVAWRSRPGGGGSFVASFPAASRG
ncbi:MAG TPA: HAMP domain-containing sensor histidine kinase [Caulobacteraceae bacterium]|jgi:signal transduction histidine kinase